MTTRRRVLALLLALLFLVSVFSGCGDEPSGTTAPTPASTGLSIHTQKQAAYLADAYDRATLYAKGTEELSRPAPILLTWEATAGDGYEVKLGTKEDLSDAAVHRVSEPRIEVYNLCIGTHYYWQAATLDGQTVCGQGSFEVEGVAPRNLYVEGVTNVRDIGGWQTARGTVRQGMIFRSAKFNADESTERVIGDAGIETMVSVLGIKTEIDLRKVSDNENGGITQSPLGEGVRYLSLPMKSGGNCLTLNRENLAALFEILADEANYPLVFHCSIGTDRTGMVAFLLEALLGVAEEDLYRDYLFSNFGEIGRMRTKSAIDDYLTALSSCPGDTLSQKAYAYLTNAGVAAADIDAFLAIMG